MRYIIFDFDGTLADTFELSVEIYNEMAEKFRCKKVDVEKIEELKNSNALDLMKDHNVSMVKLPIMLVKAKLEFSKHIPNIHPCGEINDVLLALTEKGYRLGILTSNSKKVVDEYLEKFKITRLFDFVYSGKHIFGKDKKLKKILQEEEINIEDVIYVGDEARDVEACNRAQIPVIGVSWGFNSESALINHRATRVIKSPSELIPALDEIFSEKGKN